MCKTEKERIRMIPVKKDTNTLFAPRQISRRRGRGNRRTRSRTRPATATRRRRTTPALKIKFVLRRSAASEMTPAEIVKCNHLLSGCFDSSADVATLAPEDVCVLGMLGSRVVAFMCVRVRETENAATAYVVHTVCTAQQYRGRGLLRRLFHHVATLPQFKNRAFKLEASNISEPSNGLNQTARFKIYSKTGFALPVGTEIHPSGEIVADVRVSPSHNEFMYHLSANQGASRWVRADDLVVDACFMNAEPQSNGCIMFSNSKTMREFNASRDH